MNDGLEAVKNEELDLIDVLFPVLPKKCKKTKLKVKKVTFTL